MNTTDMSVDVAAMGDRLRLPIVPTLTLDDVLGRQLAAPAPRARNQPGAADGR